MATRKAAPQQRASRGGMPTVLIALGTIAAVAAAPVSLVIIAGMVPTAVAAMVDTHPRKQLTRAVAAANLAGVVWPVMALLKIDFSIAAAISVLSDPRHWLAMYSGAGMGWLLHGAMPTAARIIIDIRARETERRLKHEAEAIVEEWGEPGG